MKWVMGLLKHGQSEDVHFYLPVSYFYSPVMYVCVSLHATYGLHKQFQYILN